MAIQIDCPDAERLRRFMLGEVPSDDAASLGDHLLHCARCAETVHSLDATDPLVQAARAGAHWAADNTDQGHINSLISRLQRLPLPSTPTSSSPTEGFSRGDTPSEADLVDDWAALLAPPQGSGEIGHLGAYRVLRVLGAGGMGVVFEAEDPQLKRLVALKAMKPNLAASLLHRQRFQREAQAIARLEHDHIVTIHQVGEDRGVFYLAMPLLKGETLEERMRRETEGDKTAPLSIAEVLRIGREIAEGLAAAHEQGLTHRDIKPANIWLEKNTGRVKILDFGLARPVEDNAHLTQSGMVAGTPQYMAPEQATGDNVDHRSDLFSLGCLLYRLTTGRLPFGGTTTLALLRALALDQPQPPHTLRPIIPPALSDLMLRLLAKDPGDRPQTAAEVALALAAIEQTPAQRPEIVIVERPKVRARAKPAQRAGRRWWPVVGSLVLLCAAVPAAWYAPAIYRFATNQGQLVIETDDPAVKVTVKQNGKRVEVVDGKTGHEITLLAGTYQLELAGGKKGLKLQTDHFTLTRGGREIARIRREPAVPAAAAQSRPPPQTAPVATATPAAIEPDQRAIAEWVRSRGGTLHVQNLEPPRSIQVIAPVKTLPAGPWVIFAVYFSNDNSLRDEDLAPLAGLKTCKTLGVIGCTKITDAGLAHLSAMDNLENIWLRDTQVTAHGLAALGSRLHRLRTVGVGSPTAIDEMLEVVAQCPTIKVLQIEKAPLITDRGLQSLAHARLQSLSLVATPGVTVGGLKALQESPSPGLGSLYVNQCGFDDAVLDTLIDTVRGFPSLGYLNLRENRFSKEGIERLAAAMPKCRVESDFGRFEPATTPPPSAPRTGPFVVLRADGKAGPSSDTLAGTVALAASGDAIEIRGNGPFVLQPIDLGDKALTLRAGDGFWPVLSLAPEAVQADLPLLTTKAPLRLEGLEFRREGDGKPDAIRLRHILSVRAPLAAINCRFVLRTKANCLIDAVYGERSSSVQVRNCQFLGDWHAGAGLGRPVSGARLDATNCLFFTRHSALNVLTEEDPPEPSTVPLVRLSNNTMVLGSNAVTASTALSKVPIQASTKPKVRIEAQNNISTSGLVLLLFFPFSKEAEDHLEGEHRALARQWFEVVEQDNQFAPGSLAFFSIVPSDQKWLAKPGIRTLEEWNDFWQLKNTGSTVGLAQFEGNKLHFDLPEFEKLSPQDFRAVANDSSEKKIGANVDLVGPGLTYERYKKTPEYQQWLSDTGQLAAQPPKAVRSLGWQGRERTRVRYVG